MKELVVFDWNGTLIADTEMCRQADNEVIKAFGGKPVSTHEYRETIILPGIHFYTQHGCNENELLNQSEKVAQVFHTSYEARAAHVRTRKGVRHVLQWIKDHDLDAAIISNHTVQGITTQLERLNIAHYFRHVLANTSTGATLEKRSKKERVAHYIHENDYKPNRSVIIGDSMEETEIGRNLGMTTVAITDGYYAEHRLRDAQPNFLIHSIRELIDILKEDR